MSATRTPRRRESVPSFTTVLEGKDLDTSVSISLVDALRFVLGLQVTQDGGRGGRAALSLRGLDPNHVIVLIDGVRLNDPTNSRGGSFDPTTPALVDIERVEIIPGSLSSVYGSDALAGVVNVITRDAGPDVDLHASLRARGGRFHTGKVVAQASAAPESGWSARTSPNGKNVRCRRRKKSLLNVLSPPARGTSFGIRDFADYCGADFFSPWCSNQSTTTAG